MFKSSHIFIFIQILLIPTSIKAQQIIETKDGRRVLLNSNFTWSFADSIHKHYIYFQQPYTLVLPESNNSCQRINHTAFSLCYNEAHEQAEWVAYMHTASRTQKEVERTDKFLKDPKVKSGSANHADYKNSGYDRGHLAPAGDMAYNNIAMRESFYYSNMSPQVPSFNRGIWKRLEEQIRKWAVIYDTIYIATGPVLRSGLPYIGPNKVSVPEFYYKAVLVYSHQCIQSTAFLLRNESSTEELQQYAISIDSLELLTGIDFFSSLPDNVEKLTESQVFINDWKWDAATDAKIKKPNNKQSISTQCNATAKSTGNRCRNQTMNVNGYCGVHQSQGTSIREKPSYPASSRSVQCSGTTKKGNRCSRTTTNPSGRCYQH